MVGMSAHADVSPTNETNAVVEAVSTNGTNVVAEAVDETSVLSVEEGVKLKLQEFAKKKGDGFAYGLRNKRTGEIYFSDICPYFRVSTRSLTRSNALVKSLNRIAQDCARFGGLVKSSTVPYGSTTLHVEESKTEASLSGLSVVFVCEATAENGDGAFGVVAKVSSVGKEVARCANKGVRPNIPLRPGISYEKIISGTDERLAALGIGPRFYYNEGGLPEVMAIGQSPVLCSEDRSNQELYRERALEQAENDANQWLSQFLAGELVGSERSEVSADGMHDKFISDYKISARASMRGRVVAAKKIIRHATGHEIAFVAIRLPVWSFPEEKPEQKTAPAKATTTGKQHDF